jgi:NAD(P)-dependent dehydrogenase (short-subunit alcohol dehydrogenase family)
VLVLEPVPELVPELVPGSKTPVKLLVKRQSMAHRPGELEVVGPDPRVAQIDAATAELGPQAVGVRCDVGNLSELDALYEVIRQRSGRIDVLVANAGGAVPAVLGDITEEEFDTMFATNVKGAVFGVQKAKNRSTPRNPRVDGLCGGHLRQPCPQETP